MPAPDDPANDTLLSALDGRRDDLPDAVRVGDESCSWAELAGRAAATAAGIAGAPAVAVRATPSMDTIVAVVAGLVAGVPVVPVPNDAGPLERGHIVRDSGAALLLGDDDWELGLPLAPIARSGTGAPPLPPEPAPGAAALVMYTSGTTGAPKGVVLSRAAVAADLDGLAEVWQWTADDHLVHGLPLFHVHGLVLGVLGALRRGCRLTHTVRPTPGAYAAAGGSMYFGVPTVWGRVAGEPDAARAIGRARLLVSGSAALPVPVFEQIEALTGHRCIERYGMTETLITISTRADGERRPGHVGVPITGVSTRLALEDGTEAPHDGSTIGELLVCGTTIFDGYLGRPETTAEQFVDGWFRTGDSAVIGPDGMHRIVGRTSIDIIKSGGFKVGAGEVESALLAHPAVREAAVVGLPDDDLGQRIVAFVVADGAVSGNELADHVAHGLSIHKRPRTVHLVESLPRNAMGKVQKTLLAEP